MNYYTNQSYIWASQVVQLGGMNYCDAVAVHAYPYGMYFSFLAGATFTNYMQQYSQLCGKPVWVTEVGQESSSSTWAATQDQQASFLNQSYNLLRSAGAKAYFWYQLEPTTTQRGALHPIHTLVCSIAVGTRRKVGETYVAVVNGQPASTATSTQNPSITSSPKPSTSLSQSAHRPRQLRLPPRLNLFLKKTTPHPRRHSDNINCGCNIDLSKETSGLDYPNVSLLT